MEISLDTYKEKLELLKYSSRTIEQYVRNAMIINKNVDTLDQDNIDKLFLKKVKFKNGNTRFVYPNTLMNRAALKVLLKVFEIKDIVLPVPKGRKGRLTKFLNKEEIDNIISNTSPKISLMVQLFFETGMRLNELINVKFEDIDFEKRKIRGIGKGNEQFEVLFGPKSKEKLLKYIDETKENVVKKFNKKTKKIEHFIFHYPGFKSQSKKVWYDLRKECKPLDYEWIHPHTLRHSLGRYVRIPKELGGLGWDLEQTRAKLRHKNVSTTQRYSLATEEEINKKSEEELVYK
jgi:integrase